MVSPFDITKSLTQTKDDLYTTEEVFNKEYNSFMINRILSNSQSTVLFANMMNSGLLDKKLQYDFYRFGIPKSRGYTKYIKKDDSTFNQDHLEYISESMNVSLKRAIEIYGLIGSDVVQAELDKRGGKK